jgi:cobalt/nickel transport system ATP-binding protein
VMLILIQAEHLRRETGRCAEAFALRGATGSWNAGWKVAWSFPRVWLPRCLDRAASLAEAMALRGFDDPSQNNSSTRPRMDAPVLRMEHVALGYPGGSDLLRDINLVIAPGERVALLGLNGCGKTTLLKAIVGLIPHRGAIEIMGASLSLAQLRKYLGYLFNQPEDQLLFPLVLEDAAFGLSRVGLTRDLAESRAREALRNVGMEGLENMGIAHLSQGQKQRVALAGLLVLNPPLLLLDEPSSSLDPPGKRALAQSLASLDAGMLIATHDLPFARLCCTRSVCLKDGRLEPWPLDKDL